ncbi:MAG: hypothetical protein WCF08_05810, partial [Anaerolineaceae bacterium]
QALYKRQERLGISQLSLMDIDPIRLNTIAAVSHQLENNRKLDYKITRTEDLKEALTGADFVITTFRVGGIESRVIDERVPLKLGLLGQETTGAGGFAMGLRGIPVLIDITDQMKTVCPDAWLINFANPAGMLVQALHSATDWKKMVGICDAPVEFLSVFAGLLRTENEQVELDYFGLNHLGWIRAIRKDGHDHLPEFIDLLLKIGGIPQFPFEPKLVAALGMIPNEYLYYYYYNRQAVANIQKAGITRGEQILNENRNLYEKINDLLKMKDYQAIEKAYQEYTHHRSGTYMQNEVGREITKGNPETDKFIEQASAEGYAGVALELIESLQGKKDRRMILNVPNQLSIQAMAEDDIVEIPCNVSRDSIKPTPVEAIPDHCLGLMKAIKACEMLTIEAALEKSFEKSVKALTLHPLVQDYHLAKKILDGYMAQHGDYFPRLV